MTFVQQSSIPFFLFHFFYVPEIPVRKLQIQVLATKETAVKVPGKVGYEKKKKKKTRKGAPAGGAARAAGKKRRIPNRKVNCPFCGDLFHYFGLPRHKGSCKARVVEV